MKRLIGCAAFFLCLACSTAVVRGADVDKLVQKLKDKDSDVRRGAAQDLMNAGKSAKEAAPALIAALKDNDAFVRRYSAQALGAIGADPATTVLPLTALLRDAKERKEVQMAAAVSLSKMGAAAVPHLVAVVRDPNLDTTVRHRIITTFGELGSDSRFALGTLVDEFMGKNVPKGRAALPQEEKRAEKLAILQVIEKLLKTEDTAIIATLTDAIANKNLPKGRGNLDQQEKGAVLKLLGKMVTSADKPLIATLSDALAGRNLPRGVNPLSPQERRMVLGMLSKVASADDKVYVTALETVERDEKLKDAQLKKAVSEALKKVMDKK